MDVTIAFILKSWAVMALIMTIMWIGLTFLTIKIGDFIDKLIEKKKEKTNK